MNSLIYSRLARGAWAGYRACLLVIAVGLLLTGSPAAFAQSIFANLSGTVTDTNGAVIQRRQSQHSKLRYQGGPPVGHEQLRVFLCDPVAYWNLQGHSRGQGFPEMGGHGHRTAVSR